MRTLDDMIAQTLDPQRMLIFGESSTGKTTLIGSLAEAGFTIVYFDMENGKSTLFKLSQEARKRIIYVGIKDTNDDPIALNTIDKVVRGGKYHICLEHGAVSCSKPECKGVGIDAYQEIIIPKNRAEFETMSNYIYVFESGTQLSNSVTANLLKGKPVDYQETLHDFRNNGNWLNRILGYLQHSNFHCIMTAHVIESEQEDKSIKLTASIGTKNYSINVGKFFDHIVYTKIVNGKYKAYSDVKDAPSNALVTSRTDTKPVDAAGNNNLVPFFTKAGPSVTPVATPVATGILNTASSLGSSLSFRNK